MNELNCHSVRASLWDYERGITPDAASRPEIERHLSLCRDCALHRGEVRSLRTGLRHLPALGVPSLLSTRLRVLASRDRSHKLVRRDLASWLHDRRMRLRLFADNLLKPFAVPAAGGILASFLCFGIVFDSLEMRVRVDWQNDIPVGVSTEIALTEGSPFYCEGTDLLVQLSVDAEGHVTDYELPQVTHASPAQLKEVGNLVLYSTFAPAVRMGRPVASKRLFYLEHMSVKG